MAMNAGSVTINPATGDAIKTGCAGEVFDAIDSEQDYGTLQVTNPVAYAAAREKVAVLANAVAKCITHVATNAVVTATVPIGIPVTAPPPAGTGATTAPSEVINGKVT